MQNQNNLIALGRAALSAGNFKEAKDCFDRALALDGASSDALYGAGVSRMNLRAYAEAIPLFETLIETVPNHLPAMFSLGQSLSAERRPEEAAKVYSFIVKASPDSALAHWSLGTALMTMGRMDEAERHLRKAHALAPHKPEPIFDLAILLQYTGRLDEALTTVEKAVAIAPDAASALTLLGTLQTQLGNHTAARKNLKKAAAIAPNNVQNWIWLANAARELGEMDEAIRLLEKAATLDPPAPSALRTLIADLYFQKGDGKKAAALYSADHPDFHLDPSKARTYRFADLKETCAETGDRFQERQDLVLEGFVSGKPVGLVPHVAHLREASILGTSFLPATRDGRVFAAMMTHNLERLTTDRPYFERHSIAFASPTEILYQPVVEEDIEGPCLLLGSSTNFGHWLLNHLSRLMVFGDAFPRETLKVAVGQINATQADCLSAAGFSEDRIVRLKEGGLYHCKDLWIPSMPFFGHTERQLVWSPEFPAFLRTLFMPPGKDAAARKPHRRIFITRKTARWRRLVNEDAVLGRLADYSFEVIDPGGLSLEEQIALGQEAEMIMGPFGAGMNLLFFAQAGAHVVELKHIVPGMDINARLSEISGLSYDAVMGSPAELDSKLIDADFTVDPNKVLDVVKSRLSL